MKFISNSLINIAVVLFLAAIAGCTSIRSLELNGDLPFADALTEATKNAASNFVSKSRVEGRVKSFDGPSGTRVTKLWTVTSENRIDSFRKTMNHYCTALGGNPDIERNLFLASFKQEVLACEKSGSPLYAVVLDSTDRSYSEAGVVIKLHVTGYKAAETQSGQQFLEAIMTERADKR